MIQLQGCSRRGFSHTVLHPPSGAPSHHHQRARFPLLPPAPPACSSPSLCRHFPALSSFCVTRLTSVAVSELMTSLLRLHGSRIPNIFNGLAKWESRFEPAWCISVAFLLLTAGGRDFLAGAPGGSWGWLLGYDGEESGESQEREDAGKVQSSSHFQAPQQISVWVRLGQAVQGSCQGSAGAGRY